MEATVRSDQGPTWGLFRMAFGCSHLIPLMTNENEIKEEALACWLLKMSCEEFHDIVGVPYEPMWPTSQQKMIQNAWRETVLAYEKEQGTQMADNGIFNKEQENLMFELKHSKNSIRVWGSFYSNGILALGYEIKRHQGSDSSPAGLPWRKGHSIEDAYQLGRDWVFGRGDKPVLHKRLMKSLVSQLKDWSQKTAHD